MVICPNCGTRVPDNQQFCLRCNTDVQAALAVSQRGARVGEGQSAPYAYSQPASPYDAPLPESSGGGSRIILIGCIAILAFCCAVGWGLVALEAILSFTQPGSAPTTPVPTPRGFISPTDLQFLAQLLIG